MAKPQKLPFFPFFPSDFDSDTQLLNDAETGAYIRLLNVQWKNGKIPKQKLSRIMENYSEVWPEISKYFIEEEDLIFNARLERERVIATDRHLKAVARAKAGADARWNPSSNASGNAPSIPSSNANSKLITHIEQPKAQKKRFTSPSLDEVIKLFIEKQSTNIEAEKFFYFYESKNWMVGRNKMKSWPSAVGGWIARNKKEDNRDLEQYL